MIMGKITTLLMAFIFIYMTAMAQDKKEDKIKKGWTFGLIPTISYNSDLGLQYGGLVTFYDYGDGSTYPKYKKMIRTEISRYTKGSGTNQIFFDSDKLFKKKTIRTTADFSYLTDKACDFYGFNGAMVNFNPDFMNDEANDYISRMFYRMKRNILRFTCDFQGTIIPGKLRWLVGIAFFNYQIGTVDISKLNEGKPTEKQLPDTALLYDKYVSWGIIPTEEADGGHNQFIKAGLIFDTRDIEANPSKGIWTELLVTSAPSFLGNSENAYTKLAFIHRQYFTLWPKKLTFVYRLGYQGTILGHAPFYAQTYMFNSFAAVTIVEGLGSAKSIRGMVRDRVVGDAIAYGNFELRWKFFKTLIGNQNVYFALNPFFDVGKVVKKIEVDESKVPLSEVASNYFTGIDEKLHFMLGCGLHIALNENFVISADFGKTLDPQDGKTGLYIGTGWLF